MESLDQERLPNLKICIDNDESGEDDDNLSLTEEAEITIEDDETDKRIATALDVVEETPKSPVPKHAAENDDVQFNVYLNKLEATPAEVLLEVLPQRNVRTYENKEGNFVTGLDLTPQESTEKLQERAKRFGLKYKPEPAVNHDELYKSLGLKTDDILSRDERGIRLDAIHLRGVNEMSTKDVFHYFKEYAPGGCEWIDDASCNVVWMDKVTAARAMLKLSRSYDQVMVEYGLKPPVTNSNRPDKPRDVVLNSEDKREVVEPGEVVTDSEDIRKVDGDGEDVRKVGGDAEDTRQVERMEDDDDLDLNESRQTDSSLNESKLTENTMNTSQTDAEDGEITETSPPRQAEEQMEDEGIEEGEIADSDDDEVTSLAREEFNRIDWPPGRWRLAAPFNKKAEFLFMRFATKADIKLPGAEKRSRFYQKYGNPNFGGIKGLLSNSMKSKLRSQQNREDLDVFGVPSSKVTTKLANRNQISYEDDMFSDTVTPVEVEEMDIYSKPEPVALDTRKAKNKYISEDEDEMQASDDNDYHDNSSDFPLIERMTTQSDKGENSGSDVDEQELNRLLGANKRPAMRMYADEIETKQKANKTRQMVGALTIVADAKKKVNRIRDARQLIMGADLRTALKEKKMNRARSPSTSPLPWKRVRQRSRSRSMSPVEWRRSRSLSSPETERNVVDRGVKNGLSRIAPMQMTIENDLPAQVEEEDDREVEIAEPSSSEEESESAGEVENVTPPPSPPRVKTKPINRRPITAPEGTKSKMDEVHMKKDVRSRLSERARDDLNTRLTRRSPNNVRSRLSKKAVSPPRPDNVAPERKERKDDRLLFSSRVRRSRSLENFRPRYNRSRSPRNRRPRMDRPERSPMRSRRFNNRSRSPIDRRFNRSRSRSPINRWPTRSRDSRAWYSPPPNRRHESARSGLRSDRIADRAERNTRLGRDARTRLGRKSRSPTDSESDSDEEQVTTTGRKKKRTGDPDSSSSSESSSSSSSSDSSSNTDSSSSSDSDSSSSSSSNSGSSSSDSESDSDASERSAIRNKKSQRKVPTPVRSSDKVRKDQGRRPRARDMERGEGVRGSRSSKDVRGSRTKDSHRVDRAQRSGRDSRAGESGGHRAGDFRRRRDRS